MRIIPLNGQLAWAIIAYYITENREFQSITGIVYQAKIESDSIVYKGGQRNKGESEQIDKNDFVAGFEAIKKLSTINTNVIKDLIPNKENHLIRLFRPLVEVPNTRPTALSGPTGIPYRWPTLCHFQQVSVKDRLFSQDDGYLRSAQAPQALTPPSPSPETCTTHSPTSSDQ